MKASILSKLFSNNFLAIVLFFLITGNSTAQQNKVLQLDGINDWIEIPETENLDIANQLTVSAWVRTDDNITAKIIEKETWNTGWTMGQDKWNGWKIGVFTTTANYGLSWGEGIPTAGRWYHIAMTFNESSLKLYVDGQLKGSVSTSGNIKLNNEVVSIGSDDGGQKFFKGAIDEVRIWNVARTESEIREWMNKTNNLTSQTALVSVWHFNESSIGTNSVIDSKGSNHGTPINMANDDCVISTAAIGDESHIGTGTNNLEENTEVAVDIIWDNDAGTNAIFSAIQLNETPYITTGLLAFKADRYWEIWLRNDDGNFQSDVKFHYDNISGINDETELKLYTRSNAGVAWSEVGNYTIVSNDGGSSTTTDGIGYIVANDLNSFSQFIITSSDADSDPLPISLLDFTANCKTNNTIELNWSTASETNNSHFEIEQSFDALEFTTIARVEGAGNSNSILNYSFLVENIESVTTYFRLKQIDFDGQYSFSNLISTNCNEINISNLEIYPNPLINEITINFNTILKSKQRIQLRNSIGVLVKDVYVDANNSSCRLELDNDLPSGFYLVVISNEKDTIVRKLVKE